MAGKAKKKFDINALASTAKKAAARRRTKALADKENRVKVGGSKTSAATGGGSASGGGKSIAARLAARQSAGIELDFEDRARKDFPAEGAVSGGDLLEIHRTETKTRYRLAGRVLDVGDVIEVYTNTASGWLRGRFEWTGRSKDRPVLGLNLWNPSGPYADGAPPWCGDLMCTLPENAMCRWVDE